MTRKRILPGSKLTVELTAQEWTDLTKETLVETDLLAAVSVEGTRRRVEWSLDDIEYVQGHVAAEANHADDPKLERRLMRLFNKLQSFLDEYDDEA